MNKSFPKGNPGSAYATPKSNHIPIKINTAFNDYIPNLLYNSSDNFIRNNININNQNIKNNQNLNNNNNYNNNKTSSLIKSNSAKKIENKKFYYDNGNSREKVPQNEVSVISIKQDCSMITRFSKKSLIQAYLDRRNLETQQKITRLKHEKLTQECTGLSFKPVISENSKKIVMNIISREKPVKIVNAAYTRNNGSKLLNEELGNGSAVNYSFNKNCYLSKTYIGEKKADKGKFIKLDYYIKIAERRENISNSSQGNFRIVIFF
jgi:hypothetical protein